MDMIENSRQTLVDLEQALTRLADSAADQVAYLAKLGVLPSVDELALEFDDSFVLVPQLVRQGHLTREQAAMMASVSAQLARMSAMPELWTEAALRSHPDWEEVRRLAALSLGKARRTHTLFGSS
jgi:hypothetical protein